MKQYDDIYIHQPPGRMFRESLDAIVALWLVPSI